MTAIYGLKHSLVGVCFIWTALINVCTEHNVRIVYKVVCLLTGRTDGVLSIMTSSLSCTTTHATHWSTNCSKLFRCLNLIKTIGAGMRLSASK